ncbi:MAG: DUF438 domain-containing protein [Firmicutes bacterium]|nr:DUF438 domain-containing protein [Bacillota bacterium]
MSELIDNRKHRQETLKGIIRDLHAGATVDDLKERFADLLDQVGASEIAEIEQSLINEGLPVEEVQRLCDVHVAVFKDSLDKQMAAQLQDEQGVKTDPLQDLIDFNTETTSRVEIIRGLIDKISEAEVGSDIKSHLTAWEVQHERLLEVDQHYSKKENILFPYLERYGISGPSSVMWATHDEIRAALNNVTAIIGTRIQEGLASPQLAAEIGNVVLPALNSVSEMIYKEENILFPLCRDTFTQDEWKEISAQFKDPLASVYKAKDGEEVKRSSSSGAIDLDVGLLTPEQINLVFKHLPIDVTYVDEKDEVAYFSLGAERIFERTRAVIGRKVQFCHPPASMGVVERILDDFKNGRRDSADFWINMKDMVVYIRYFAVRDSAGNYRGTLEVTQNIAEIQKLTGEKRIYDYQD